MEPTKQEEQNRPVSTAATALTTESVTVHDEAVRLFRAAELGDRKPDALKLLHALCTESIQPDKQLFYCYADSIGKTAWPEGKNSTGRAAQYLSNFSYGANYRAECRLVEWVGGTTLRWRPTPALVKIFEAGLLNEATGQQQNSENKN